MKSTILMMILICVITLSCAATGGNQRVQEQAARDQPAAVDGAVHLDTAIGDFSSYINEQRINIANR